MITIRRKSRYEREREGGENINRSRCLCLMKCQPTAVAAATALCHVEARKKENKSRLLKELLTSVSRLGSSNSEARRLSARHITVTPQCIEV